MLSNQNDCFFVKYWHPDEKLGPNSSTTCVHTNAYNASSVRAVKKWKWIWLIFRLALNPAIKVAVRFVIYANSLYWSNFSSLLISSKKRLKYFSSIAAVKIGKKKSLLTNDWTHFFLPIFTAAIDEKYFTFLNIFLYESR